MDNMLIDDQWLHKVADLVADRVLKKLRSQPRMVTREEYAAAQSLGVRTVDRAIAEGRLRVERVGRRVLIPVDAEIQSPNRSHSEVG